MSTTAEHLEKNIEQKQEQLARHTDPAYSLEKSKEEWETAVEELRKHLNKEEDVNPVEFTEKIRDLTQDVEYALRGVQDDIRRIAASDNPGWIEEGGGIARYSRRGYSRIKRDQFDDDDV